MLSKRDYKNTVKMKKNYCSGNYYSNVSHCLTPPIFLSLINCLDCLISFYYYVRFSPPLLIDELV